jgi:ABC-type multidrug transport system permease subunit
MAYGFDSILSMELKDTIIPCANNNLIPNYLPQYQNSSHQACAGISGARPFQTAVTGEAYLASLSYGPTHIWRNVGVLFAWWVLCKLTPLLLR